METTLPPIGYLLKAKICNEGQGDWPTFGFIAPPLWRMSLTRVEEALENLQANYVADRNNFKGDFFKEKTVEKYIFVFTPILIKLTFSGCRCAAFYD